MSLGPAEPSRPEGSFTEIFRGVHWGPQLLFDVTLYLSLMSSGLLDFLVGSAAASRLQVCVLGVLLVLLLLAYQTARPLRGLPASLEGRVSGLMATHGIWFVIAASSLSAWGIATLIGVIAWAVLLRSRVHGPMAEWWVGDHEACFDHDRIRRDGIAHLRVDLPLSKVVITLLDGTRLRAGRPDRLDLLWRVAQLRLGPGESLADVESVQSEGGGEILFWRAARVRVAHLLLACVVLLAAVQVTMFLPRGGWLGALRLLGIPVLFVLAWLLVRAVYDREVEKTWLQVRGREATLHRQGVDHRFVLEDVMRMDSRSGCLDVELRDGRSFSLRAADPIALRQAFAAVGAGVLEGEPVEAPVQLRRLRRRVVAS